MGLTCRNEQNSSLLHSPSLCIAQVAVERSGTEQGMTWESPSGILVHRDKRFWLGHTRFEDHTRSPKCQVSNDLWREIFKDGGLLVAGIKPQNFFPG